MTERPKTIVEELATVVRSLTEANEALRRVIEEGASDQDLLEKFEDGFLDVKARFEQAFMEKALEHIKKGEELKMRIDGEIQLKRNQAESLKRQIDELDREIDRQTDLSVRLKHDTDVGAKRLHDLQQRSIEQPSSCLKPKSPQIFIQRLQNELE